MRFRRLAPVLAALALASLVLAPQADARATAPATLHVGHDNEVGPVGTVEGCGPGYSGRRLDIGGVACFHTSADPAPSLRAVDDERVAPKCYGNGVNGNRIQLVYMYVDGRHDDRAVWVPKIVNEWAPEMEATFRLTSRQQGRELGLRFHAPGCKLSVTVLSQSAAAQKSKDMGGQINGIYNSLAAAGMTKANRKYLVWYDGQALAPHPCGVGTTRAIPVADDNPTPANSNNLGQIPGLVAVWGLGGSVAIAFKSPHPTLPDSVVACWGHDSAHTETHELLHTMGAVQLSSPNSNGLAHCRDEPDIMCYREGGVKTFRRCGGRVELLDCGSDDYFHANPVNGSYLSTHWNIANSTFLGAAAGFDDLPLELPSP
ncbi:MAG TPA: hypothetical protein VM030_07550 [Acidimicrobiales bacterium]|nr:hypothetical protein [Acidimicrobiales bacterium]